MHQWKEQARGFARRAFIGFTASLTFTLIAFEWTTYGSLPAYGPFDPIELPWEPQLIHVVPPEAKKEMKPPAPAKEKWSTGPVKALDEVIPPDPVIDPVIDRTGPEIPAPSAAIDTATAAPAGMNMPLLNPEILPHFANCSRPDMERTKECTEQRIQRHLERNLRIPEGMMGSVRTTVTFEIDAEGSIGRIHCAPKVDPLIEEEIVQVIRSLPRFVPGSQGGHPVAVYYQIPLVLRRN